MCSTILTILDLIFQYRGRQVCVALLAAFLLLSLPNAYARHNKGNPRPAAVQQDEATVDIKSTTTTTFPKKNPASQGTTTASEPVAVDQPAPVEFSSRDKGSVSKFTADNPSSGTDVAPVVENHNDAMSSAPRDRDKDTTDTHQQEKPEHAQAARHGADSASDKQATVATDEHEEDSAVEEPKPAVVEPLAVTWYREKAAQGDVDAQFNLAMVSETGFGINVNEEAAVKWYAEAAEQGHVEAQLKLGMLYLLGAGAAQSNIKGGKWIRSAARQDNRFARVVAEKLLAKDIEGLEVGHAIQKVRKVYNSKGPKQAEDTLLELIAKAQVKSENKPKKERFAGGVTGSGAKAGSVGNRVPDFLSQKKAKKAVPKNSLARVRRLAKEGIPDAQFEWGQILEEGDAVPADKAQAVKWYQAAAEQNHPGGQYKFGVAKLFGVGVTADPEQGRELLAQSARQKHPVASKLLKYVGAPGGGKSGQISSSIVLAWHLENAIENKNGDAMLTLGYMFQNGWGVVRDPAEGSSWMVKAKSAGAVEASRELRIAKVSSDNNKETDETFDRDKTAAIIESSVTDADVADSRQPMIVNRTVPAKEDDRKIARAIVGAYNNFKRRLSAITRRDVDKQKPLLLLFGGLILGFIVFRVMRRPPQRHSQHHPSAYRY